MKSLAHILIAIQDIANTFEGSFTLKNAQGKYFYANENWLELLNLEQDQLIGKTDDELFPSEHAALFKELEQRALDANEVVQYTNTISIGGLEISYVALKWVVRHKTGEVFCYCTMGDLVENKKRILVMQPKIQQILEMSIIESDQE